MNSCGQGIEETLGGISGEVDGYVRSGGDRSGDFDVESDLTVGVRVGGAAGEVGGVGGAIDSHGGDSRLGYA